MEWTSDTSYDRLTTTFDWDLPSRFNIGVACSDAQPASSLALIDVRPDGEVREHTFGEITEQSNRLGNALAGLGVGRGDRVGIVLPQRLETGLAHLATAKIGAVALPLSNLFGPEALSYRLADSGASLVLTDPDSLELVADVAGSLGIDVVVTDGAAQRSHHDFDRLVAGASARLDAADTGPDDPALLIYTSGTTGQPKGTLHGHRVLLGHLPGYELMYDFFPRTGDRVWTPADWAWIGGLMDALLPAWYHGVPVVAAVRRGAFDSAWAVDVMADHRVRVAFLPPTVLKLMRQAAVDTAEVALRAVMSGGESLGSEMLEWSREHLGVTVNEIYGQTEANIVVGNCSEAWDVRPGSMGRPYPGHEVAIIDATGAEVAVGATGEIAVGAPDPVMFLEYWNQPEATAEKFTADGRWLRTGDLGHVDEDGYLHFASRSDDVIISAGYRIGPAEIEECLLGHPAVAVAAAVGVPDATRGQVVKAFVQLADGHLADSDLEADIAAHVRGRLAAYEYPRQIEFVTELPMTTTGKIRRAELRAREEQRTAGRSG